MCGALKRNEGWTFKQENMTLTLQSDIEQNLGKYVKTSGHNMKQYKPTWNIGDAHI